MENDKELIRQILREGLDVVAEDPILADILGGGLVNEESNFSGVLDKVKGYAKKGALSAAVLTSLMSNPSFTDGQKTQIKNAAQTEKSTSKDGESQPAAQYAKDTEDTKDSKDTKDTEDRGVKKATDGEYERVRGILRNDMINHAGAIQRLWGSKDATKRSLFRKKLAKEKNDDGGVYEFDKEEMTKLISILDNLSSDISNHIHRGKT